MKRDFTNSTDESIMKYLDINERYNCISMLNHCLDDASRYKHVDHIDKDKSRCTSNLETVLEFFNEARRRLPASDKRMLHLESTIAQLEDETKMYLHEMDARDIGNVILGFILKIYDGDQGKPKKDEDDDGWTYSKATINRSEIYLYGDVDNFEKYFMGNLLDSREMLLLSWMDFQIQLLQHDAKRLSAFTKKVFPKEYFERPYDRNFLNISAFSSVFDKLIGKKCKPANQLQVSKEDDGKERTYDELIFTAVVKIAEARQILSNYFAHECRELCLDKCAIVEAIVNASECFNELLLKLPVIDYDLTLQQWVELKMKPKFLEYIRKAKLKTQMQKV